MFGLEALEVLDFGLGLSRYFGEVMHRVLHEAVIIPLLILLGHFCLSNAMHGIGQI